MSKDSKSTMTPRLRFPEFLKTEGWETVSLGEQFLRITNGKANAQDHEEGGAYPLFDRSEVVKSSSRFVFDAEAIILPGEGVAFRPRYFKGKFNLHQRAYALMDCQGHAKYFYYALDDAKEELAHKAVKSTVLSLRLPIIEKFAVFAPNKVEQQKIGDCLTSLDEVIAAQGRKVESLKTYKRGLMQELFPREGETLPRRRFPEFRDGLEWEEKVLGEVSPAIFDGTHQTPAYTPDGVPFYSVENLISGSANKFISRRDYLVATRKNRPEKGDLLLTRIGKIGYSQVVTWDHEFSVYVTLAVIKRSPEFNSHYLHYFVQSDSYQSELRAKSLLNAVPPKINLDSLRSTKVLLPREGEQQHIADCLFFLDAHIAAESGKFDSLKTHKKGLMQQLFPLPEEV